MYLRMETETIVLNWKGIFFHVESGQDENHMWLWKYFLLCCPQYNITWCALQIFYSRDFCHTERVTAPMLQINERHCFMATSNLYRVSCEREDNLVILRRVHMKPIHKEHWKSKQERPKCPGCGERPWIPKLPWWNSEQGGLPPRRQAEKWCSWREFMQN